MKDSSEYLCYCGLYCKMCSLVNGLPQQAQQLFETMKEDGWESFGKYEYPDFEAFWKVLDFLKHKDKTCALCQGGCGDPSCEIRICAQNKHLAVCAFCDEFPCAKLESLFKAYPFIMENNKRIRDIGIEAWLIEQDNLVAQGITNKSLMQK
ncbi:MAG: DUF3795 domain-containing protein [Candidatus Cloacimonetes bacterium]|nr:DUF3795 domain-containing protein [Candidatus Cloacimonadota bacterium]